MWPTARQYMTGEREIAIRMAEDVTALIRERGADAVITIDDLQGRGWSLAQVYYAGIAAIDLVRAEQAPHADVA